MRKIIFCMCLSAVPRYAYLYVCANVFSVCMHVKLLLLFNHMYMYFIDKEYSDDVWKSSRREGKKIKKKQKKTPTKIILYLHLTWILLNTYYNIYKKRKKRVKYLSRLNSYRMYQIVLWLQYNIIVISICLFFFI